MSKKYHDLGFARRALGQLTWNASYVDLLREVVSPKVGQNIGIYRYIIVFWAKFEWIRHFVHFFVLSAHCAPWPYGALHCGQWQQTRMFRCARSSRRCCRCRCCWAVARLPTPQPRELEWERDRRVVTRLAAACIVSLPHLIFSCPPCIPRVCALVQNCV